ncbi:MAG: hypothetical protein ACREJM_07020, partial [Candidatus Saccharimonadales bacterium]
MSPLLRTAAIALLIGWGHAALGEDGAAEFVRGINLNGSPVAIDGRPWEGKDSPHYQCDDMAFDNQQVVLVPPTDEQRAVMIRSSRWGGGRNQVRLVDLPPA